MTNEEISEILTAIDRLEDKLMRVRDACLDCDCGCRASDELRKVLDIPIVGDAMLAERDKP